MASVYQKIHALALKAQARHQLQLKTAANFVEICRTTTDCSQEFDNPKTRKASLAVVPHIDNLEGNIPYVSNLDDSVNPIDKTISDLRHSSIPYFSFENNSKPSRRYVMLQSEDGWYEDLEENDQTGPTTLPSKTMVGHPLAQLVPDEPTHPCQTLEIDSDTDSSSSAPSTEFDSESEHWLRTAEEVVTGGEWGEGLDDNKVSQSHHGNEDKHLTKKDTTLAQNIIPLKGMARLRRISPRSIITTAWLHDSSGTKLKIIQGNIAGMEPNHAEVPFPLVAS